MKYKPNKSYKPVPPCSIRVLNVGEGDLNIKFDKTNAQERANAKKIVTDLLRQGFAIMVQAGEGEKGPLFRRVKAFDADTNEYIVMGTPSDISDAAPETETPKLRSRPRKQEVRVPATMPTVAVARSAGGYDPIILSRIKRGAKGEDLGVLP